MKDIVVGLSGGLDSSMALFYLKEAGWNPIGVTLKVPVWERSSIKDNTEIALVREMCERIGVPHFTYNVEEEFRTGVVQYFLDEFKEGRTPNPCIVCNRDHKFKYLFQFAEEKGIEHVASGHYARTDSGRLLKARDIEKDQTYYLALLGQEELGRIVFPLGNKLKSEVRQRAKKEGFDKIARKKESQNWCFVADKDLYNFLKDELGVRKGEIVFDGKVVGEHEGLWFYTIGQRKGLKLSGGPYYVKEMENNQLIITKDREELLKKKVILRPFHLISGDIKPRVMAKVRYGQELAPATIEVKGDSLEIIFDEPQLAPTPGQFCVFYSKDVCLGGGMII